jgi:uncharacterized NAD(P)/FAD-binding protein YdhS
MTALVRTIVVVGAGFSGTTVAVNLLRLARREPLRVVLVDREPVAGGIAYRRRRFPYLLNVPAGWMSATSVEPSEFLAFAQRRMPDATAQDFLPRDLYGEYLEWTLSNAERASPPGVELHRVQDHAIAVERSPRTSLAHVHLAGGRTVAADAVVLALGNAPPAPLAGTEALLGSPRYIEDPWSAPQRFRVGESVLVVGTGLTMADIVVAGVQSANGPAVIHAISRHGLLPAAHTACRAVDGEGDIGPLLQAASHSMRRLLRTVRDLTDDLRQRGGDWREAMDIVRNVASVLWRRLSTPERRRFLRHARAYWDIHRHRLPESTLAALGGLRKRAKLHIHAGRLLGAEQVDEQIRVTWRVRGAKAATVLLVDRVINATGPDYNARRTRDPLLRSLLAQGVAVADPLGLGLVTGEFGSLLDTRGRAASHLYYVGPLLRANHWETTATRELRDHAERLAYHLVTPSGAWRADQAPRRPSPVSGQSGDDRSMAL